jgi:hypothetical protein
MKNILATFLFLLSLNTFSQITIDAGDMPNVGDTIRKSITTVGLNYDFSQTGNDFVWDYSNLSSLTQDVDSFISVGSTPLLYQLAFNNPFDPNHRATIALPTDDIDIIPGFPLTDIIEFYKESSSEYKRVGMGISVAGIPLTLKYDIPELFYDFPLTVGDVDSTTSSFSLSIPSLGFISLTRKRVNSVDGWGMLTTPYGTHPVIRVKSIITENDSIYVDSLGVGLPINRNIIEYHWLGNNFGIPLLHVTEEGLVTTISYIDNFNSPPFIVNLGLPQLICEGESAVIKANVNGGCPPYNFYWSTGSTLDSVVVSPATNTVYAVTVVDSCNDTVTANALLVVTPNPVVDIGNDTTIYPGDTLVLDAGSGIMNTYLWSDGTTGQTLKVSVAGTYWVEVTNFNGCTNADTIIVSIDTTVSQINGTVSYDNNFSTPLEDVTIYLIDNTKAIVDSTKTDSNGHYQLNVNQSGTYTIKASSVNPWGGVNSTDALGIMQYFTGLINLSGLRLIGADIDLSGFINSVDALYAAQRFVMIINSFPSGDWIFENPTVIINAPGVVVADIKGLCVGDIDGSYLP